MDFGPVLENTEVLAGRQWWVRGEVHPDLKRLDVSSVDEVGCHQQGCLCPKRKLVANGLAALVRRCGV